jgi:predicted 3-demethylubiquinone-9 3-methyltransferase (glyoxalase superfamily)
MHPSRDGMQFAAMDSARAHGFAFNEAVFFIVHSETQEEIDYYRKASGGK